MAVDWLDSVPPLPWASAVSMTCSPGLPLSMVVVESEAALPSSTMTRLGLLPISQPPLRLMFRNAESSIRKSA